MSKGTMFAIIGALSYCNRIQVLYMQGHSGFDEEVRHKLIDLLTDPLCIVWGLSIGETSKISVKAWNQFSNRMPQMRISFLFPETHFLPDGVYHKIKEHLRSIRKKRPAMWHLRDYTNDKEFYKMNTEAVIGAFLMWVSPYNVTKNNEILTAMNLGGKVPTRKFESYVVNVNCVAKPEAELFARVSTVVLTSSRIPTEKCVEIKKEYFQAIQKAVNKKRGTGVRIWSFGVLQAEQFNSPLALVTCSICSGKQAQLAHIYYGNGSCDHLPPWSHVFHVLA